MRRLLNTTNRLVHLLSLIALVILALAPMSILKADNGFQTQVYFTDLSLSTSGDGPVMTYFPLGVRQIFARWSYGNIPVVAGSRLHRDWYINGKLFLQKEEPWNYADWSVTGRLTHISIYDFEQGLQPGYYHVVISLIPQYPGTQVETDFVVAGTPAPIVPSVRNALFSDLTVSTSAAGPSLTYLPAGAPLISARWNYDNIPVGTMLQRDWYLNGVLFRSLQEPWSAYWGPSGRLTHIAMYDYEHGMPSGTYRLVVFLPAMPAVRAEVTFSIGTPGPQYDGPTLFNNLTFSTAPNGSSIAIFPHSTREIFARWDYNFVSPGSQMVRRWYRNGTLWLERQEPWTLGTQGTAQFVSIYDYDYGLLPGDYYVEVSLIGYPNSLMRGFFTVL